MKSENKYAVAYNEPFVFFNGAFKAKYVGRVYNEILTPLHIPDGYDVFRRTTYMGISVVVDRALADKKGKDIHED